MYERFNNYTAERPKTRKFIGWFLVIFGFFALITPLTPGGVLFFVGLEILGIRFIGIDRLKRLFTQKATPKKDTLPL